MVLQISVSKCELATTHHVYLRDYLMPSVIAKYAQNMRSMFLLKMRNFKSPSLLRQPDFRKALNVLKKSQLHKFNCVLI